MNSVCIKLSLEHLPIPVYLGGRGGREETVEEKKVKLPKKL